MTVALLIYESPDHPRLVPVAPESVFTEHWQRGCAALGLEFIPLCQAGTDITQDDLPVVLAELSRLKQWMESPESGIAQGVLDRIATLIVELERLRGSTSRIWIG
jgi:hypothetical protein